MEAVSSADGTRSQTQTQQQQHEEEANVVLNINLGLLGHIDSGKTSLAKALSTIASTASFDRSPQSAERGITLDLGFSSFRVPLPEHLRACVPNQQLLESLGPHALLQYTVVDCPGHASLIRTIIGGAQIVDVIMLVVDAQKGLQPQTAECLVIAELTDASMVVALNKVDLLAGPSAVEEASRSFRKRLSVTRFAQAPIVPVAARPGQGGAAQGLRELLQVLVSSTRPPRRSRSGPFVFALDHCFALRGQGTVLTGTVLSGTLRIGQTIELPAQRLQRKVKSLQVFRRPVEEVAQGERVGVCVTQLEPRGIERGLACAPGLVPPARLLLARVERVRWYRQPLRSRQRFHLTVGHSTVMCEPVFFRLAEPSSSSSSATTASSSSSPSSSSSSSSSSPSPAPSGTSEPGPGESGAQELFVESRFEFDREYEALRELEAGAAGEVYALLRLEAEVAAPLGGLAIASRLDTDLTQHEKTCRLAFHGRLLARLTGEEALELRRLRVYRLKRRQGQLERLHEPRVAIVRGLFTKDADPSVFFGMRVHVLLSPPAQQAQAQQDAERRISGCIEAPFGKSGKVKVRLDEEITGPAQAQAHLAPVVLVFKRYVFDPTHRLAQ